MIIIEFLIHFLKLVKQRWTIHNCYVSLKYKYGEDKYSTSPLTSNFPFGRLWGSAKIILKFLIKQRTKFSIKYLKFYGDLTERWRGKPNLDKQVWTINNYTGGTCSQREKLQRWAQPGSRVCSCVEQTGLHRHQSGGHREGTEDISVQGKLTHCWLVNC